ncbi:hypothetical protein LINGRAHAP2_LOCUS24809 [Linum grandiflorum]
MVNLYSLACITILLAFSSSIRAQNEITTPEQLDLFIRDSTFKSIGSMRKIKTGEIYNVDLPANLSGITAHAGRFRCGSLKRYGTRFQQLGLGVGLTVLPCLVRVMVITQSLGSNWSSIYTANYDLSGYQLVSPILGLKAYDYNTSNPNPFEVAISSSQGNSITINFSGTANGSSKNPLCAIFEKDGKVSMKPTVSPQVCASTSNGHYGLVVPVSTPPAPSPAPVTVAGGGKGSSSKTKRVLVVVGSVVGGVVVGLLVLLLFVTCVKAKEKSRMAEMERRAYEEEALDVSVVGNVRAPVASGTRTVPTIEHEFIPHNPS